MITLKWRTLFDLYSGIIGKSLILISLASPVSILLQLGLDFTKYRITLAGALTIAIAYIILTIKIPVITKINKDYYSYADSISRIHKEGALDQVMEFKCLENSNIKHSECLDKDCCDIGEIKQISDYVNTLGEDKAVRNMAIIKYCLINHDMTALRFFLTVAFYVGALLIYYPLILTLKKIYLGG